MSNPINHVHSNFGGECRPEDISPYVLLPTDASHVEKMVEHWQSARKITHHYEFLIYTGEYKGVPVTACSVGLGGVSVATAIEELSRLGAHTFFHIGLANPAIGDLAKGDLVISTGAVRLDGTSKGYVMPQFPALAHFENVMAAITAAEHQGFPYHVGTVSSFASSGLERVGQSEKLYKHVNPIVPELITEMERAGVYGGTGEEAVIFVQSALYGLRAGAISVSPLDPADHSIDPSVIDRALITGLDAMSMLAKWDREKEEKRIPYILPK